MMLGPKNGAPPISFQPKVVLFGYGVLGESAIEVVSRLDASLVGVVVPTNRTGLGVERVKEAARRSGVVVLTQPGRTCLDKFLEQLRALSPDIIVVWSYSMILPPEIIKLPRLGCVNLHGGILPEYRGGHVMQWAIINGETETGVTLHYIDESIDTGPIIAKLKFPIGVDDDGVSVQKKLGESGAALLSEWWQKIIEQTAPKSLQDDAVAHYYRLLTPDDGLINWRWTSVEICNRVRALVSPRPGAFTFLGTNKVTVHRAKYCTKTMTEVAVAAPGIVQRISEDGLLVVTGDGAVNITEFEINDGFVSNSKELSGFEIKTGSLFTNVPVV